VATHGDRTNDDRTPEERELFASLATERTPPSALKARTLDAVHRQYPRVQRSATLRTSRLVLATAAALVIFIAGTVVGYVAARRATPISDTAHSATHEDLASAKRDSATINQLRYVVWY
jgi:hypothetical protein